MPGRGANSPRVRGHTGPDQFTGTDGSFPTTIDYTGITLSIQSIQSHTRKVTRSMQRFCPTASVPASSAKPFPALVGPLAERPGLSPRSPRQAINACFESAFLSRPLAAPFQWRLTVVGRHARVRLFFSPPAYRPWKTYCTFHSALGIPPEPAPLESGLLQVAVLGWLL